MIERQVKELFERAAAAAPSEQGAYDRFLRHRRRRIAGTTAAACLVLAVAIGLAVLVPRLEPDRRVTTTGPKPARPATTFSRPDQGFELDMPRGWSRPRIAPPPEGDKTGPPFQINSPDDPLVRLELTSPHAAGVEISTGLIDPRFGGRLGIDATGVGAPGNLDYLRPAGTLTAGRRADGRGFLRTVKRVGNVQSVDWYVAWPFQCALGPKPTCPTVLRLRVLHVNVYWSKLVTSARMLPAGQRVVESVRPAGNAVERSPVAGHRPCGAGGTDQVGTVADYRGQTLRDRRNAIVLDRGTRAMQLRAVDYALLACRLSGSVALQIMDGDKPAAIRDNGLALPVSAKLPEYAATAPREGWALWEWTNWCGSRSATAWLVDPTVRPAERLARFRVEPPPCLDPKSPPVLQYGYTT